jgi:hypothetical protein
MKNFDVIFNSNKGRKIKAMPVIKADKGAENYREHRKGKENKKIRSHKEIRSQLLFKQITVLGYFSRHSYILEHKEMPVVITGISS